MNCMSRKVQMRKEEFRRRREEEAEKKYRESLSEEALAKYLENQKKSQQRAAQVLSVASVIGAISKYNR